MFCLIFFYLKRWFFFYLPTVSYIIAVYYIGKTVGSVCGWGLGGCCSNDRNTCEMRINLWRSFILRAPKRAGPSERRRPGWIVSGRPVGARGDHRDASAAAGGGEGRRQRRRRGALFVYGYNRRRPTNRKPLISPAPAYNA